MPGHRSWFPATLAAPGLVLGLGTLVLVLGLAVNVLRSGLDPERFAHGSLSHPVAIETLQRPRGAIEALQQAGLKDQVRSDGLGERRVTSSRQSARPHVDGHAIALFNNLKQLKKRLTKALRSRSVRRHVQSLSAASPGPGPAAASNGPRAPAPTSSLATSMAALGRAPADDSSAGPWEFPGEPGLYSELKRPLGQVPRPC